MLLLPVEVHYPNEKSAIQWKIRILSTGIASMDIQNEYGGLFQSPGRQLGDPNNFETRRLHRRGWQCVCSRKIFDQENY